MVLWVNRALVQAPRNGTTTHTVAFPPATAGSLLVCLVEGSVTSSTPAGWTLPAGGSAVNNTGLYVWWKVAAAGESSLTTTHNASDYPVAFLVYELPSGSAFVKSIAATGVSHTGANPNLTGLTGTNLLFGAVATGAVSAGSTGAVAWSGSPAPTEDVDVVVVRATTDGYLVSVGYAEGAAVASWQPTATISGTGLIANKEALTFAVNVPAGGGEISGDATFTGAGSLTPSGAPRLAGSMLSTAVGSLTATGSPKMGGQALLSGVGALAAAGSPRTGGTVILTGTGALSTVGTPRPSGAASMTGTGTLSTEATGVSGTAMFGGTGSLTASGVPRFAGAVSLTAAGILATVGTLHVTGASHFTGYGTLTGGAAIPLTNITVTGSLRERAWSSSLTARHKAGALTPNRWAGTL